MSAPFRALLADDERPARKRLRELLLAHPEVQIIGEADNVETTVDFALRESPDVIFLDIQMPPGCGFDALPFLQPTPRIVFVTAYDAFAVKAFEANAFDYLLKPVHPERLAETVRRLHASEAHASGRSEVVAERMQLQDLVPLRDKGHLRIVPVNKIAAIKAEAAYSNVLICREGGMLVLKPICEWESRLPFPPFTRLDRSLLVNLDLVRSVEVLSRDETHLTLEGVPDPLLLGRSASTRLRRLLP